MNCWICGKFTLPVSIYGAGRFERYCHKCEVKWVEPDYWLNSNAWKEHEGYAGYEIFRHKMVADEMKRYQVDELVEFDGPEAPGAPA